MAVSPGNAPISSSPCARPSDRPARSGPLIYGRRHGRRLRSNRKALLDTVLPALRLALPAAGAVDIDRAFPPTFRQIWLEIGFGAGEHLLWQLDRHPDVGMVGCEPFVNGIAAMLARLAPAARPRLRVWPDDARQLLAALAAASIARVFVLFPDPWPKKRHHRRRLIGAETVNELARILRPEGELRLATDHAEYGRWMLAHLLAEPRFVWLAERPADWRERPADWPPTRYEAKAIAAGRQCLYLRFRRQSG